MDLEIAGRRALIFGAPGPIRAACEQGFADEGVTVTLAGPLPADGMEAAKVAADESPDILLVITDAAAQPLDLDADDDQTELLVASWEAVVGTAAAYRAALPAMRERGWGRLIAVLSNDAKALAREDAEMQRINGLGILGMAKALSGEMGETGITVNCILWDPRLAPHEVTRGIAGSAVFLASACAAYLTGTALTLDDGITEGMF